MPTKTKGGEHRMMWTHYCKPDKAWLSVERGEPCNWCDAPETPEEPDDADDELE